MGAVQVRVLPVTDRHAAAAEGLVEELRAGGIRAESSDTTETLPKRVRLAEMERVPYIAVLGDREAESGGVSLRTRGAKQAVPMGRAELVAHVAERIRARAHDA